MIKEKESVSTLAQGPGGQLMQSVIAPTARHVADECYATMRQELQQGIGGGPVAEAEASAFHEMKAEIQGRIAEVTSRIEDLVQQELQQRLWNALNEGGDTAASGYVERGLVHIAEVAQEAKRQVRSRLREFIEQKVGRVQEAVQQEVAHAFQEVLGRAMDADAASLAEQLCKAELDVTAFPIWGQGTGLQPAPEGALHHPIHEVGGSDPSSTPSGDLEEAGAQRPDTDEVSNAGDLEEREETLQGAVRLRVQATGDRLKAARFINDLRGQPQLRILQLLGDASDEAVEVSLILRETTSLKKLLLRIEGVVEVEEEANREAGLDYADQGQVFAVRLA